MDRHYGDYKVQKFTCWKQFLCMAFGQLTHRESLSDTVLCLKANENKLYHLGIGEVAVYKYAITKNRWKIIGIDELEPKYRILPNKFMKI